MRALDDEGHGVDVSRLPLMPRQGVVIPSEDRIQAFEYLLDSGLYLKVFWTERLSCSVRSQ
jgi:hypothetical protein